MAAVRTLLETSVPRWSSNWTWGAPFGAEGESDRVRFVVTHDRSIDVILNNQRGEGFVKHAFLAVLSGGVCAALPSPASSASAPLTVLDIGANTGYYSMLSAAHGCRVLAVDAQPGCAQWFERARAANEANASRQSGAAAAAHNRYHSGAVRIITRPVSNSAARIEMDAYSCWVMHKTDVKLKRRRARRAAARGHRGAGAASDGRRARAAGSPPATAREEYGVPEGRVAAVPLGTTELHTLLAPHGPLLLAKVDVEGAELGVVAVLAPLLARTANLLVEVAPGWWPLHANRTAAASRGRRRGGASGGGGGRAGRGRGGGRGRGAGKGGRGASDEPPTKKVLIVGGGSGGRTLELGAAEAMEIRRRGAEQFSRLLAPVDEGGAGFAAVLTSGGLLFERRRHLRDHLVRMGGNGYWNQEDMWFARDGGPLRRAQQLLCLRQRAYKTRRAAAAACGPLPLPQSGSHASPRPPPPPPAWSSTMF